jgi:hypothetical protein
MVEEKERRKSNKEAVNRHAHKEVRSRIGLLLRCAGVVMTWLE